MDEDAYMAALHQQELEEQEQIENETREEAGSEEGK